MKPAYDLQDFARRLDVWMRYLGWSLHALAGATGIDRTVIWKWQKGRGQPRFASADAVLRAMGLTLHEFFDDTPEERLLRVREVVAARGPGGGLRDLELEAGDLLCAVNRVPRAALLADELGPGPADLASTVGVERLVTTALGSLDGYPLVAREGRHRVVAHALSDLEHGLRARRFAEEDVATLDAAWRRLTKADDGG